MKKILKAFVLTVVLTGCSSWFQGKVAMDIDTNPADLTDLFKSETKIDSLDAPEQLFASQGLFSGSIKLIWSEVDNATSYRIERAVVKTTDVSGEWTLPDEGDFESLDKYCIKNSYTDILLSEESAAAEEYEYHYFYRVFAENKELGLSSEATDGTVESTRGEGWLFAPPSNVQATKGKSTISISVTWYGVKGASGYKVYRGESAESVSLVKSVYGNTTTYTDTISTKDQGTEFYYKVVAVNSSGNESAFSTEGMGYSLVEGAPAVSAKVTVEGGFGTSKTELNIKWDEVGKTSETSVIKYNLYRTSSTDSVYKKIGSELSGTSYTDSVDESDITTGIIYYYYVQTVSTDSSDGSVSKSAFTETSETSFGFLLSAPSDFEVLDGSTSEKVILSWSKATGSDYADFTYKIYMSESQDGTYNALNGSETVAGTWNSTTGRLEYEVDKNPFFKLTTVNSDSLESDLSEAAAPTPAAPENVTASKASYMTGDLLPNSNNVYPVKITWEKPDEDNPAGYYVYRSTKTDSGFRKLNDSPVTECEYVDDSDENITKVSVPYYYKVVSINSLGQGKKGNDPKADYQQALAAATDGQTFKLVSCLGYGVLTADQWFREYNKTCMNSQKKLTLMHKPVDTDKLGSETVYGTISGSLGYNASLAGLGAKITMPYKDYADFYINDDSNMGILFTFNGNTDTSSNMSGNGNMSGTVKVTGMYPGSATYGNLEIKGGAAGGGYYGVTLTDQDGNELDVITNNDSSNSKSHNKEVYWLVGEEGRN